MYSKHNQFRELPPLWSARLCESFELSQSYSRDDIAVLVFTTLSAGQTRLQFTPDCEFVNPDETTIEIKGFGEGVIDAR